MAERKIMKDISLNEPVSVTAPAFVWVSLIAAYNACEWSDEHMNAILGKALREVMDPVYAKEQEAAAQEAQDQSLNMINNFMSSLPGAPKRPDDDQF